MMKKFTKKSRVSVPFLTKSDMERMHEDDIGCVQMKKFHVKSRVKVPDISISPSTQKVLDNNREIIEHMRKKPWICRLFCNYRSR